METSSVNSNMIIDCHAHVFAHPRIARSSTIRSFNSADEQIQIMDRLGIFKAVILPMCNPEASPELQSINEILEICQKYPERFIPFCNLDPRYASTLFNPDTDHFEFILKQYKQLGCKGLGEVTCKLWWDDPRLMMLLEACQRVDFPVIFHASMPENLDYGPIDTIGFPRLEKVLQTLPRLKLLGHSMSFWAEISGDVTAEDKFNYPTGRVAHGGTVIRLMDCYENLYGDLSANSGLNALKRDPDFAWKFIERFSNRLFFGLDFCSPEDDRQHITWLKDALNKGKITSEAYENIMWKNISNLIDIDIL